MVAPGRGRQLCAADNAVSWSGTFGGLPDGVEALHPKDAATALIGDEPLQLIGFVVQLVWSGYR
jgi:hypothetical protein